MVQSERALFVFLFFFLMHALARARCLTNLNGGLMDGPKYKIKSVVMSYIGSRALRWVTEAFVLEAIDPFSVINIVFVSFLDLNARLF